MSRKKRPPKPDRIDGYSPPEPSERNPWTQPELLSQMEQRARHDRMDAWNIDGFKNELTGIGDWMRDKTLGGHQGGLDFIVNFLTGSGCEARWRGSDLGGRIVETIPDEMTREGWEISIQPEEDGDERSDAFPQQQPGMPPMPPPEPKPAPIPEPDDEGAAIAEEIDGKLEELCASDELWEALCYERAYGGGAILVGADDGQEELSKPLDEERITDVRHLTAFSGGWDGEIIAWSYYRDPRQPKYGQPEVYMIRNTQLPIGVAPVPGSMPSSATANFAQQIFWVHESRLLVFPGTAVSHQARVQMRGWGDSVFTRCDEVLQQYGQTWGGIANLMTDFSQGVLSVDGLSESLMANNRNGTKAVTNRALAMNIARSISRVLLIDSTEKFQRDTTSLAGLGEMLQQFALRLAAAVDMPVTLLMGQAPAGLNATGESDIRFFYDRVAAKQKKRLLPQLRRLIRLVMLSREGPTGGKEPSKWNVKANPLFQMSEKEQAELRKIVADTDAVYIGQGVLTAEEVAASAYGGSEWTMERTIDFAGRQEMADQDEADRAEREKTMLEAPQPSAVAPPKKAPPEVE